MLTLVFMNILIQIRIICNMTYEEYKNEKEEVKNKNILKVLFNKLFTVIIFTMFVIICSNYSPKFKSFVIDDVLNTTMDFSKVNNIINKVTSIFKVNKTMNVGLVMNNSEKYMNGVKYKLNGTEEVLVKDSGIVTFIGNKDGYNNTIIIQQSNGYYAWYGNINESVKLYDYVEKGSILGSASNEYYYVLYKDNKAVELDEN